MRHADDGFHRERATSRPKRPVLAHVGDEPDVLPVFQPAGPAEDREAGQRALRRVRREDEAVEEVRKIAARLDGDLARVAPVAPEEIGGDGAEGVAEGVINLRPGVIFEHERARDGVFDEVEELVREAAERVGIGQAEVDEVEERRERRRVLHVEAEAGAGAAPDEQAEFVAPRREEAERELRPRVERAERALDEAERRGRDTGTRATS